MAVVLLGLAGCVREGAELSQADRSALAALREGYTAAWERGDTAAILITFSEDATLVPHLGAPPAEGLEAIERHFWPPDRPAGTVTSFDLRPAEVEGTDSFAYERGRYELRFTVEGSGAYRSAGNYLAVSRQDDAGRWRWVAYMWNHPPPGG